MKKWKRFVATGLAAMMVFGSTMTSFAAQWQRNDIGWWWQEDNGTWPANTWKWLDGNGDNIAECYYFDGNGYMLANTTTPDNYQVNADGAWIVNDVVQTQIVSSDGGPGGGSGGSGTGTGGSDSGSGSTSVYDNGGYDSYGVSNVAMEMINNTREENAKFGEILVDIDNIGACIYYANGFFVLYPNEGVGRNKFISASDINPDIDGTHLFKYWIPDVSMEEAANHLHRNGFSNDINGAYANGPACWVTVGGGRSLLWQKNSLTL